MVRTVLALNPVAESHIATPAVPAGASATPEFTAADPRVTVAFEVIVNAVVATFPRLSVTVTFWLPATKLAVSGFAVITNWNTDVPCSVTIGDIGMLCAIVVRVALAPFPILTLANNAPGPNPDTVAVTSVPTGPEEGVRVTVGVLRLKVVVAVLPQLSVKVNAEPVVIAGRLTVPVYAPVAVITFELSVVGTPVTDPAATAIVVPAKDAAVIISVGV